MQPPKLNIHTCGQEQDLWNHGQDLVGRRLQRHDHYPAPAGPLPQVLHQEERVEDVHALGWLIKHHLLRKYF